MDSYYDYDLGPYQVQFLGKAGDQGQTYEMVNICLFHKDGDGKETEQEHKCFYVPQPVSEIRRCLCSEGNVEKLFGFPEYSRVRLSTEFKVTSV